MEHTVAVTQKVITIRICIYAVCIVSWFIVVLLTGLHTGFHTFFRGIVNMCGNFSASVLYPFAAIRETSVCGYQCQGFPRSGACTLDTDIHICYNF